MHDIPRHWPRGPLPGERGELTHHDHIDAYIHSLSRGVVRMTHHNPPHPPPGKGVSEGTAHKRGSNRTVGRTRLERETSIIWNEADPMASVWTFSLKEQRRLRKLGYEAP